MVDRSPLVAQILARQKQRRGRPVRGVGQLLSQLGAQAIDQSQLGRLKREEEQQTSAANEAIARALQTATGGVPSFQNPDDPTQQLVPPVQGGTSQALAAALSGLTGPGTEDFRNQLGTLAINQAFAPQQEQFEPVTGPQGNIVGQRSSTTGQVIADPRATAQQDPDIIKDAQGFQRFASGPDAGKRVFPDVEAPQKEGFENITDDEGNIIAQRNTLTNQIIANPSGVEARRIADAERESIKKEAKQETIRAAARQNVLDTKAVVERLLFSGKDAQGNNIDNPNLGAAFGKSGLLASIPGSQAADTQAQVNTLKARMGFEQLQKMREASPTGGALGQVAVQELEFLQATVQNLSFNQSDEQARENIKLINESLDRWLATVGQAENNTLPEGFIDNGDGTFTMPDGQIVERE